MKPVTRDGEQFFQVNVTMPRALVAVIDAEATTNRRSRSSQVAWMLERYVEQTKRNADAAQG